MAQADYVYNYIDSKPKTIKIVTHVQQMCNVNYAVTTHCTQE